MCVIFPFPLAVLMIVVLAGLRNVMVVKAAILQPELLAILPVVIPVVGHLLKRDLKITKTGKCA